MEQLSRSDLMTLEQYHEARGKFRAEVLAHKKNRQVAVGPHATLYFEDRQTIQYQIQEMLRIERIFESAAIEEELSAYNPLIPDGMNLKATFMIEYADVEQRRDALARLAGIEDDLYAVVDGFDRVMAIADEDLDRSSEDKTSAVHFLRFEFTQPMIDALRAGAALTFGSSHSEYQQSVTVDPATRMALLADFD